MTLSNVHSTSLVNFLLLIEFHQRLKFNFLNRNALKRMQTLSFCDHVAQQRHVSV